MVHPVVEPTFSVITLQLTGDVEGGSVLSFCRLPFGQAGEGGYYGRGAQCDALGVFGDDYTRHMSADKAESLV